VEINVSSYQGCVKRWWRLEKLSRLCKMLVASRKVSMLCRTLVAISFWAKVGIYCFSRKHTQLRSIIQSLCRKQNHVSVTRFN